jgi:transposase
MLLRPLLPDHHVLALGDVRLAGDTIAISVSSTSPSSQCPQCCQSSERIHSHYERKLADLPWQGFAVHVRWHSRKFFCDNPLCAQRIFTERLPEVAESYSRKTCRMAKVLFALGLACGGESGARLAGRLGMVVSPDSLLRAIRRGTLPESKTPRVLGVDDWAFRRGHRYGTILCDLERHRPVDLLPERSSAALADWLKAHPGVEIVSRDRGDYYIKGATEGAPDAVQVTDRWHLLKNLREALVRQADRHCRQVEAAARAAAATIEADSPDPPEENMPSDSCDSSSAPVRMTRAEQLKQERRARRLKRYRRVIELHAQGVSRQKIARQLGMHRRTVRRFLTADSFPERAERRCRRKTDPFVEYLRRRWDEGCHKATQLTEELRREGFDGSYDMVRRRVAKWRCRGPTAKPTSKQSSPRVGRPSSNRVVWLLLKPPAEPSAKEQALMDSLAEQCPSLEKAAVLAREFAEMVRQRQPQKLPAWIDQARASPDAVELHRFAKGLTDDLPAVTAALSLPWSNGQTEGQVNRLKLIKRQMFGRASFDLLRQRVLCRG